MTQNTPATVAGKAVYLEFVKGTMTTQLLIMPEGMTQSRGLIPMTLFRRRISASAPRKTWKMTSAHKTSSSLRAFAPEGNIVEGMLAFVKPHIDSLRDNNWTPFKDPIVIEVTSEDLEQASHAKTPYKAIGRVLKVRKALGFPKELVRPTATY